MKNSLTSNIDKDLMNEIRGSLLIKWCVFAESKRGKRD